MSFLCCSRIHLSTTRNIIIGIENRNRYRTFYRNRHRNRGKFWNRPITIKNVYKLAPDTKEQVTVLGCVSAAGDFCNPFVIYPGVRPRFNLQDVNPNEYDLGHSHNGWMNSDLFFEWLANIFYPSIKDKVTFPILILLDGHVSHLNLAVSAFCRQHDIIN